jgi:hypothetical protein
VEAMMIHDNSQAQLVTYASIYTGNVLMTFTANIVSGHARLYGIGQTAGNMVKLQRTYVKV